MSVCLSVCLAFSLAHTHTYTPLQPCLSLSPNSEDKYDGAADIWSLGITAIELAEVFPPLSNQHPVRVLFLIPRNEPPKLKDAKWTDVFRDFLSKCLCQNQEDRWTASRLLTHPFVAPRPAWDVVSPLISYIKKYKLVKRKRPSTYDDELKRFAQHEVRDEADDSEEEDDSASDSGADLSDSPFSSMVVVSNEKGKKVLDLLEGKGPQKGLSGKVTVGEGGAESASGKDGKEPTRSLNDTRSTPAPSSPSPSSSSSLPDGPPPPNAPSTHPTDASDTPRLSALPSGLSRELLNIYRKECMVGVPWLSLGNSLLPEAVVSTDGEFESGKMMQRLLPDGRSVPLGSIAVTPPLDNILRTYTQLQREQEASKEFEQQQYVMGDIAQTLRTIFQI